MQILTLDFQVSFCREIVALPDGAGVAASVSSLGLLDDQCEGVLVILKTELWTLVAFLDGASVNIYPEMLITA